jgi:hypothetical protein
VEFVSDEGIQTNIIGGFSGNSIHLFKQLWTWWNYGRNYNNVMEYLCHKWPRIWSTCRKHFPVLSSFLFFLYLANHKQELPMAAILVVRSAQNMAILHRTTHISFIQSNNLFSSQFQQRKFFPISANTKLEARWAEPVSLICHFVFEETLYRPFHRCCLPNFN